MKEHNKEKINIGVVTGAVGLRGEVKIFHFADDPDMLRSYEYLDIGNQAYRLVGIRYRKKIPILKLEGIEDRSSAESLIKKNISVDSDAIADLPQGSYYIKDLIGLCVISEDDNSFIGRVKDVISGRAQDVYEIETEDSRNMLLPAVSPFVREVDVVAGIMKVSLPQGIEDILY